MSNGDSIGGILTDLAKETVKQTAAAPFSIVKGMGQQIVGHVETEEEKLKKQAEKQMTFQRIQQIEAEMAHLRQADQQKKGPEMHSQPTGKTENIPSGKHKTIDEASRQAVGRAEQGRNFKG